MAQINLTTEITELSVEEIAGVTGLLAGEKMGWETTELLLARWAMLDPRAALAFALGREELSGNVMIMDSIMGELAKTDLPAAKAALAQIGDRQQDFSERTIVRQLLEKKDIRTALAFAREMENNGAETEVLLAWSESDPLAAAAELIPGRESHQRAAAVIAEMLISKDRALFETWAKRLADPGQQAAARHVALTADADIDPKGAALATAEWLASGPEAVVRAGNLPAHIVQRWLWSGEGHAQVAAWAVGLPEGTARNSALNEAGRLWIEQDTMQASAWLGSLPQSEGRDSAVAYLVEKITGETPADAMEWALTLKTPSVRKSALKQLTENWIRKDPEASRQALEALSAEDRSSLQEPAGEAK